MSFVLSGSQNKIYLSPVDCANRSIRHPKFVHTSVMKFLPNQDLLEVPWNFFGIGGTYGIKFRRLPNLVVTTTIMMDDGIPRDTGSRVTYKKIEGIPTQLFPNDTATSSNSGTTNLGCKTLGISFA